MAYTLAPVPQLQFLDNNGAPLAGGLLYSYAAGSSTPLATAKDSIGTANSNPVQLDGNGRAVVYLTNLSYKLELRTALGVLLWSQDHVDPTISAATGTLAVGGALTVSGNTALAGTLTVGSTLGVTGAGTFTGNLAVGGALTLTGPLTGAGVTVATYVPVWGSSGVAPAIGNGTLTGQVVKIGSVCLCTIDLIAGATTGFGTGTYAFVLPFAASVPNALAKAIAVSGRWQVWDDSASVRYGGTLYIGPAAPSNLLGEYHSIVTAGLMVALGAAAPVALAVSDEIHIAASYIIP